MMLEQKVEYIHTNPVNASLVEAPENWRWSSAVDFDEETGLLELAW